MAEALPIRHLALFASGMGTNFERICTYFAKDRHIRPAVLFCNNAQAAVVSKAQKADIPVIIIGMRELNDPDFMLPRLAEYKVTHLILSGFNLLVPDYIIRAFPEKILNLHPALLPKFGGKGMYGEHVHRAVLEAKEHKSGISIHLINKEYDKGRILFQAECEVKPEDTPESLLKRVHRLEYKYFPKTIKQYINTQK